MVDLNDRSSEKKTRSTSKAVNSEMTKVTLEGIQPFLKQLQNGSEQVNSEIVQALKTHLQDRELFYSDFDREVLQPLLSGQVDRKMLSNVLSKYQISQGEGKDDQFFLIECRSLLGEYIDSDNDIEQLSMVGNRLIGAVDE
ncbi:hypothetical protein IQ265_06530 [Nodosilinea sp. LEGE 06152]|uniref:hypothetical protein n=1 Tax=Nodosilinea sp. LEGE 06152 TaxID=2777966 RepID=UPI001882C592|nr:hypothetical protein [Nodosilinea sp. LEGE 06152]MBE9156485.1 hypothetical protein [Nodosilinea sp. LEGE 06152]